MADLTVLHWNIAGGGGAEALCLYVIEALQEDHDITLVTGKDADINELNEYYGTSVSDLHIEIPSFSEITFESLMPVFEQLKGGKLGFLHPLRFAAFHRACRPYYRESDLVINTYCEMESIIPSIQYMLYPQYNRAANPFTVLPDSQFHEALDHLVTKIGGPNLTTEDNTFLAISQWTANLIENLYDVEPDIVYPPINTEEFNSVPDIASQESGFVMVSRILPEKRQLEAIEIIRELHEMGHDIHIHIVGPPASPEYADSVRKKADKLEYVIYDGKLSRPDLVRTLKQHKYGLHTMTNEHFGIVVAEMIAAKTLPFVPREGGPREIINQQEALLYESQTEAVRKIDEVLSNPERERQLHGLMPNVEEKFGVERFKRHICSIVDDQLR